MKRNMSAILGMMVALAALVFVVTGCTGNNPVAPAIDNTGGELNSPGSDAILSESEIDGDMINDDIMTGIVLDKEQPGIVEFEPDQESVVEIPERVDAADFIEQDYTR